jgi:hypothetical protein
MRTLSLRAIFLLGFVIVMPLLALPVVARRLDDWLYGPPPAELARQPLRSELQQAIEPLPAEQISPATFEQFEAPATLARRQPHEGLDALSPSPPPLDPLPAFDRIAERTLPGPSPDQLPISPLDPQLDEATTARLEAIRGQLEALGAEYVLLETTDRDGEYRFCCQLRQGQAAADVREFESLAADPLAAAEKVLADVSAWRIAARPAKLR